MLLNNIACTFLFLLLALASCKNNTEQLAHNNSMTPPPVAAETPHREQNAPLPMKESSPKVVRLSPFIKMSQITRGQGLNELSGQLPTTAQNEFWGINDKGNNAELFRFRLNGTVLQKVKIKSIKNDDWEAIARHPDGSLLIGGVGDNNRKKDEYFIHQIDEPDRSVQSIDNAKSYKFVYSDGRSHNCEAMFVMAGELYLITKEEGSNTPNPLVFRLETLRPKRKLIAHQVTRLNAPATVTGAAYDESKKLLAVLAYSRLYLFRAQSEPDLLSQPIFTMNINLAQCEGVCFYGDEIIVSNEAGELWATKIEMEQ